MSGSCSRGWTWSAGVPTGREAKKFKHGHVAYQIYGDDEYNRMKVKFYPRVKLVTLGEVKRSNIIKFQLHGQFQRFFYQTSCMFSQI